MGIYISGVKGLPEQVQENKENIKDIQEEISGIDWDAIHNLENQVAENTQDINNMEGTIGTQNIAITQLGGRVDDLEDKTQDITRQGSQLYIDTASVCLNADLTFESDAGNDIVLNNDLDTKIVSSGNSSAYIGFDSGNRLYISSDTAEYEFSEDTIKVNGTPIGKTFYQHNIMVLSGTDAIVFTITNNSNTQFTFDTLKTYINNNGFVDTTHLYPISGVAVSGTNTRPAVGLYYDMMQDNLYIRYKSANTTWADNPFNTTITLTDTVIEL